MTVRCWTEIDTWRYYTTQDKCSGFQQWRSEVAAKSTCDVFHSTNRGYVKTIWINV